MPSIFGDLEPIMTSASLTDAQIQTVADQVQVHKFGGSSLADAFRYRRVARIVTEYAGASDLVVVSAAGDTTNRIIAIIDAFEEETGTAPTLLKQLKKYQQGLIDELLSGDLKTEVMAQSNHDFARWDDWLAGKEVITNRPELLSYGELWSARLLANLLKQQGIRADYIDARSFLIADDAPEPHIRTDVSRQGLLERIAPHPGTRFIVTGFICKDPDGRSLILGRNGSDYSATLVGSLIDSKQVTIWKDVAGVYSADPRKVERSEEHTSELQSRENLVCRLQLEKKKKKGHNSRRTLTCIRTPRHGRGLRRRNIRPPCADLSRGSRHRTKQRPHRRPTATTYATNG